jgi:hypothetical protein
MQCEDQHIFFSSYDFGCNHKIESKPTKFIDSVLQPLKNSVNIKINGSFNSEYISSTIERISINKNPIHFASKG